MIGLHIDQNMEKPIFIQIAEQLEDSIFTGIFPEETKLPSTNEIVYMVFFLLIILNEKVVLNG